jgi:hypothetical protein
MPTKQVSRKNQPKMYARKKAAAKGYQARRRQNLNMYRAKKRKFQASRRPFVEVKSRSHREFWATLGGSEMNAEIDTVVDPTILVNMTSDNTPTGQALLSRLFPLWSYYNPVQGVTEKDMLGRTLTAKYLTAKVHFEFPQFPPIKTPRYYLIHGWCKIPTNLTEYTTPSKTMFTRGNLLTHIENHIKRDFDQNNKDEFLIFKEKTNKDYIVLGYKRIKSDRNANTGVPPTAHSGQIAPIVGGTGGGTVTPTIVVGSNPIQNHVLKWPLNNRKIKYRKGKNNDTLNNIPFFYDNKGWAPFFLYYCPDAGTVLPSYQNSPSIAYNDKFWFTDS